MAAQKLEEPRGQAHAIEVDLVLSRDRKLVLSHDPWIDKELCRTTSGGNPGHVLIRDLSLQQIQSNYLCGHSNLSDLPDAEIWPESILSFAEMLELVVDAPELAIYLDLKIQPGFTRGAREYAEALEQAFRDRPVSNRVYLEGPTTQALRAYRNHVSQEFHAILSYPPFYAGENWTIAGALAMLRTYFNAELPVEEALAANTDFIASPPQVLSDRAIDALRDAEIGIILYTANDRESFDYFCGREPELIITDYPELGPCAASP
ncbi:MAG: hypothetical protein DHS20C12_28370 [Pseudohongiella sp.]|nr:MAG: hypothetical protein DHS20C12_28370 [Pseudohongiella sp.]